MSVIVTDIATVDTNASLRQVALLLERHRIGCLSTMKDYGLEDNITDTDFVGVAINLFEQIEESELYNEEVV